MTGIETLVEVLRNMQAKGIKVINPQLFTPFLQRVNVRSLMYVCLVITFADGFSKPQN